MKFTADKKSIKKHEVPIWFHDAKLGIFIHWGLYSVPAFAVTGVNINETIKKEGLGANFRKNPYAEWYLNSLRIPDTPTQKYHIETYGKDFAYDDFIPMFNEAIKKWNPNEMVNTFKKAGAKYVVLVTKHHDGFLMWPSKYPNPKKKNYHASRDVVGELTKVVKSQGLKMGFYYSGALDWSFNLKPIKDLISFLNNGPMDSEYVEYVNNHWHELIDRYEPLILWNDIGYPPGTNIFELFAYFYNKFPDGLVNDRWMQVSKGLRKLVKFPPIRALINWIAKRSTEKGDASLPTVHHYDFSTPEYSSFKRIVEDKWECTRGIGNSFGFNEFESEKDYLTSEELIRMLIDIVSKNGNLLLNVGPMADGTIPEIQKKRLLDLGKWLEVNGEAIYGTRPWIRAEGKTLDNFEVRYTQKEGALFAIMLDKPKSDRTTIRSLKVNDKTTIHILGYEPTLEWNQEGDDISILIPKNLSEAPAYSFKISPKPEAH